MDKLHLLMWQRLMSYDPLHFYRGDFLCDKVTTADDPFTILWRRLLMWQRLMTHLYVCGGKFQCDKGWWRIIILWGRLLWQRLMTNFNFVGGDFCDKSWWWIIICEGDFCDKGWWWIIIILWGRLMWQRLMMNYNFVRETSVTKVDDEL